MFFSSPYGVVANWSHHNAAGLYHLSRLSSCTMCKRPAKRVHVVPEFAMKTMLSLRLATVLAATVLVQACAAPEITETINDPYETQNRAVHEFNKGVAGIFTKPRPEGAPPRKKGFFLKTLGNFAGNLDSPRLVVNDILQANAEDAAHNGMRFLINTTFGIAGLFDPATAWGLPERPTDFGETLHTWGAAEGAYVELPLLGPSTSRDTAGTVVDFFLNPVGYAVAAPEKYVVSSAGIVQGFTELAEYGDEINELLQTSADSYAATRLLYLQNRRFQLGQTVEAEEIDPFALDTEGF
ncbi:MAG: VacJ lipoprotein [Maritimibacter sp.]|nr:VacJ lipoprotein [Maritimibacter sp.]